LALRLGFVRHPIKIHGNLQIVDLREISRNSGEILAKVRENLAKFRKK